MRILKFLLALVIGIVAVAAGVFAAAAIAVLVVVFLLVRWARRRFGKPAARRPAATAAAGGDVIDVTATEIRERNADGARSAEMVSTAGAGPKRSGG